MKSHHNSLASRYDLDFHQRPRPGYLRLRRALVWAGLFAPLLLFVAYEILGDGRAYWAGPLTSPHQAKFAEPAGGCSMCHTKSMQPLRRLISGSRGATSVADENCLKCHAQEEEYHESPHEPAEFWHSSLQVKGGRFGHSSLMLAAQLPNCATCHEEHRGDQPSVQLLSDAQCLACHRDLATNAGTPSIHARVTSFDVHPEFAATRFRGELVVATDLLPGDNHAARRHVDFKNGQALDRAALHFNHEAHLQPSGPTGRSAEQLTCRDCHLPDASGQSMRPISFDQHCARCHKLSLDAALVVGGSATLPHLKLAQVYDDAKLRLRDQQQWPAARKAIDQGCAKCHVLEIAPSGDADQTTVAPPRIPKRWFPSARFGHDQHQEYSCVSCHDPLAAQEDVLLLAGEDDEVERFLPSRNTADILLPGVQVCRKCHVAKGEADWVPARAGCVGCHPYHPQARQKSP